MTVRRLVGLVLRAGDRGSTTTLGVGDAVTGRVARRGVRALGAVGHGVLEVDHGVVRARNMVGGRREGAARAGASASFDAGVLGLVAGGDVARDTLVLDAVGAGLETALLEGAGWPLVLAGHTSESAATIAAGCLASIDSRPVKAARLLVGASRRGVMRGREGGLVSPRGASSDCLVGREAEGQEDGGGIHYLRSFGFSSERLLMF